MDRLTLALFLEGQPANFYLEKIKPKTQALYRS